MRMEGIGNLSFLPSRGDFRVGTIFLKMSGKFEENIDVAVLQFKKSTFSVEVDTLLKAKDHSNVLRFHCKEENPNCMLV